MGCVQKHRYPLFLCGVKMLPVGWTGPVLLGSQSVLFYRCQMPGGWAGQALLLTVSYTPDQSSIAASSRLWYETSEHVHFSCCQSPLRELKPFPEMWSRTGIKDKIKD